MNRGQFLRTAAFAATGALTGSLAWSGDTYPQKTIFLVVPNPPGGMVDTSARLVGDSLAKALNATVVVDNRGGANGNVAYGIVARAPSDGYTLLVTYSTFHVGNPSLMQRLPWAQKDFAPVALVTVSTNVIAVHPSIPANTLSEFIAYLKRSPGKVSYASQGVGSVAHIGTEMFKESTGTNMLHVPYRGSGAAIQDVLSGQVQVFITSPPSVLQHIHAGKLKALAVTGSKRHPGLPNVPTVAEAGVKDFDLESWVAIFAPAATPPEVVATLTTGIRQALDTPDARNRAEAAGIEIRYMTPVQLEALVKRETPVWAHTIKHLKITID